MTWNFVICGAIALVLAVAALTAYRMWEEWVDVVLGLWLIASPWILNFSTVRPALWSAIISGAIIVIAAGWNLIAERQQAGHPRPGRPRGLPRPPSPPDSVFSVL